jgi:hypothetical protein
VIVAEGERMENRMKGGIIVNGPKFVSNDLICEMIKLFKINSIIVIDDDSKFNFLIDKFHGGQIPIVPSEFDDSLIRSGSAAPGAVTKSASDLIFLDETEKEPSREEKDEMDVILVPKAGGVLPQTDEQVRKSWSRKLFEYFHGPDNDLICHNFTIPLRELNILKIIPNDPNGVRIIDKFKIENFNQNELIKLKHSILSIVLAPTIEECVYSTTAGIVWVRDIMDPADPINCTIHLMCPSPGPLISNYLVAGSIKYYEQ